MNVHIDSEDLELVIVFESGDLDWINSDDVSAVDIVGIVDNVDSGGLALNIAVSGNIVTDSVAFVNVVVEAWVLQVKGVLGCQV